MSLRNQLKQLLRMCGHAFVATVHERLNHTDKQLDIVIDQNNALARGHSALLQSSIHTVESLRKNQAELRREIQDSSAIAEQGHRQTQNQLQQDIGELSSRLERLEEQLVRQVAIETSDYGFTNPEVGLMAHLYSFLPSRKALDVGAHLGEVSARLLETGFEVYAFEPHGPVYDRLAARLGENPAFHGHRMALGGKQEQRPLHLVEEDTNSESFPESSAYSTLEAHAMPEGMAFRSTVDVEVTTLASLHASGAVPNDVSLVKIDTEGLDLEVIRGMEHHRYPVVLAEYWDEAIPFWSSGLQYTLENLVTEMRGRGYPWHLVLYRTWGHNETAFYANHPRAVANSWGNAVFFRDFALFQQAQSWCSAVLPRTYFKSVSG